MFKQGEEIYVRYSGNRLLILIRIIVLVKVEPVHTVMVNFIHEQLKEEMFRKYLEIFIQHGAHPDILVDTHPHIGSNKLPKIISAVRQTILECRW